MRHGRTWKVAAGAAALALLVTACGDDDEDAAATDTTAAAADEQGADSEYCVLARELDSQDEFFTVEQLEQLRDLAPDEIRDEIEVAVPVFIDAIEAGDPFAAFEDPVVDENIEAIETFENEVCGTDSGGDSEEAVDFEVAPEDEEFCAIATELDQQEDFPSPEQLEAYRAAAPEEVGEAANTVVQAFIDAGDDPFAVFEDEEIGRLFEEELEPFETEHCGLHLDDEEEDEGAEQDPSVTEADASAAQVAVTAADYDFTFDPAPAAGRTQFTMTNEGDERHVMVLFKLADGATMDDVLESEGDEGTDGPEFESDSAAPGETAILTTDLEPGSYGMICYIPNSDGVPHLALGMVEEFTVQ